MYQIKEKKLNGEKKNKQDNIKNIFKKPKYLDHGKKKFRNS